MWFLGLVRRLAYLRQFFSFIFLKTGYFLTSISGTDKTPDGSVEDHALSEQDPTQRSPLSETLDVKPSEVTLPLALPLGTEDHMLLPVTDSQSPTSDTLLRATGNGFSEPQLIFLQQLYWLWGRGTAQTSLVVNINISGNVHFHINPHSFELCGHYVMCRSRSTRPCIHQCSCWVLALTVNSLSGRDLTVAAPFWAISFRHGYSCLNSILIFDFFVPEVKSDLWIFFLLFFPNCLSKIYSTINFKVFLFVNPVDQYINYWGG